MRPGASFVRDPVGHAKKGPGSRRSRCGAPQLAAQRVSSWFVPSFTPIAALATGQLRGNVLAGQRLVPHEPRGHDDTHVLDGDDQAHEALVSAAVEFPCQKQTKHALLPTPVDARSRRGKP